MSDNLGVNVAYAIRTFDGRELAYGAIADVYPLPPKPVIAYPSRVVLPQTFSIGEVEQRNCYYIGLLIEHDGLLYEKMTAPQEWTITFIPVPSRVVFAIGKEDGRVWVAPPDGEEGQIRVERLICERPSNYPTSALFELIPVPN